MTIDIEYYKREMAEINAIKAEGRNLREQQIEGRKEATVRYWKLLRMSLVDLPPRKQGGKDAVYDRNFEMLRQAFGTAGNTFFQDRSAAAKIQTSTELLRIMNVNSFTGWPSVRAFMIVSPEARRVQMATRSIRAHADLGRRLLAIKDDAKWVQSIVNDYLRRVDIEDDIELYAKGRAAGTIDLV